LYNSRDRLVSQRILLSSRKTRSVFLVVTPRNGLQWLHLPKRSSKSMKSPLLKRIPLRGGLSPLPPPSQHSIAHVESNPSTAHRLVPWEHRELEGTRKTSATTFVFVRPGRKQPAHELTYEMVFGVFPS